MQSFVKSTINKVVEHIDNLEGPNQSVVENIDWQVREPDAKGTITVVGVYGQPALTLTIAISRLTPTRVQAEYLLADLAIYRPERENFILKGRVNPSPE